MILRINDAYIAGKPPGLEVRDLKMASLMPHTIM